MSKPVVQPDSLSPEETQQRREEIRRGLVQANTAALVVIAMVVVLAVAAALAALRAERNEQRAQLALWDASVAQARAQRLTREMGQRVKSLAAVRVAARIRPAPELREEAIAALALPDFEEEPLTFAASKNALASAVDGRLERYAFIDRSGTIEVRRTLDDSLLARFSFLTGGAPCLVLSPDGLLLAAKFGNEVRVWSVSEARLLWETHHTRPLGFDTGPGFDPTGELLALPVGEATVEICAARTGEVKFKNSGLMAPGAVVFHPRTNILAVACVDRVRLWDYLQNKIVKEFPPHDTDFLQLSWTADGGRLMAGGDDGVGYLWNVQSGEELPCRGHLQAGVRGLLRPQGDMMVTLAWDRVLRVWDTCSGEQLFQAEGCQPLGFSADGTRLAVMRQGNGIHTWRVHPPAECRIFTAASNIKAFRKLQFGPDGRHVIGGTDEGLWIWNLDQHGPGAKGHGGRIDTIHFRRPGHLLTTGNQGILDWELPPPDAPPGVSLAAPVSVFKFEDHDMSSSVFMPDQRLLVNVSGVACLYDFNTGKLARFLNNHAGLDRLAISPDGRWIASGCWFNTYSRDSSTCIWSAASGEPVLKFGSPNSHVTFSPDNKWFVAAFPNQYQLRESGTWKPVRVFDCDVQGLVPSAMSFSPDGQVLALRVSERKIRLVDPANGIELARFSSPDGGTITELNFSPDGTKIAAATERNLQVWDLTLLRENLRSLHLDWPDAGQPGGLAGEFSMVDGWAFSRQRPLAVFIVMGVLLAAAFAWIQQRYQRRLLARYMEVDALVTRRNAELRAAQAELAHSQKMRALGTLAAGIAHDFNNLLSVIRMSSKLIDRAGTGDPEIKENVEEIETAVQQGKAVVRSMLGYSRRDEGRQGPVYVPEVVEDCVGLLSKQFLSGLALKLELDEESPPVVGSHGQVDQVLLNLIVNAAEAMAGQGELRIAVRQHAVPPRECVLSPRHSGPFIDLLVADTGPGIAVENRLRIFEAFFTTKSFGVAQGTGLGLSTVYTIAERAGYGIALESEPGRGAAFHIYFPIITSIPEGALDSHTDTPVVKS